MFAVPKFISKLLLVLLYSASLLCFQVWAADDEGTGIGSDTGADFSDEVLEWKFREDVVDIPGYPDQSNLVKLDIDTGGSPFEYFIDKKSLSIGIDGIVLYSIVMQSRSGGRNVLFEGMHCNTGEYKTHAYGTSRKTFYAVPGPVWKPVKEKSGAGTDYRYDLLKVFFCDLYGSTLKKTEILQRIEYPEDFSSNSGIDG